MAGEDVMGLHRARTMFAWERTALSLMVVGLLLVRVVGPPYLRFEHVLGLVIVLLGVVVLGWSRRRGNQLTSPGIVPATRAIRMVALGTVLGGAAAIVATIMRVVVN